jgi:uncharacterized protein YjaG (DUF416 family)
MLNAIHIRHQNEVWFAATFMVQDGIKLDMVRNFSQLCQETELIKQSIYGIILMQLQSIICAVQIYITPVY